MLRESPETSLRTTFRVALCQDCRIRRLDPNPTEANYFVDLCRYLERPGTAVDVLRVFFVEPPPYALEIVQTCDLFYMCGGDPGQTFEPWELFSLGDGYAFLELRMHGNITKLKGGSPGRYVLMSDQRQASMGADCPDCEVKAMFIVYASAPEFVKV